MSQSPDKALNNTGKQSTHSEATTLPEDYQQLLLAYQVVRQERDMLLKALRAFRLSRAHQQLPPLKHRD